MELDPEILAQLVAVFRVELDEQLGVITDGLLALEKAQGGEPASHLDRMFRAAHNIKGAARGVGITDLANLSHALESLFSRFKRAGSAPPPALVDLCLASLDRMRALMDAFGQGRAPDFDLPLLLRRLEEASHETPADAASESPPPPLRGEAPEPVAPAGTDTVVRIAVEKLDRLSARADAFQMARIQLEEQFTELKRLDGVVQAFAGLWARAAPLARAGDQSRLAPELLQLLQGGADLVAEITERSSRLHRHMRRASAQQLLLSNGFQEEVRMLRLVPAATVLRPLSRAVRDIARELDKQVELVLEGDQIELDRQVLEGLRDPLNHLLRNAVDHGIEMPAARRLCGKPEVGRIRIEVDTRGGEITLEIADDGAGIDVERVARVAVQRGVISDEELIEMDEATVRNLVFRPGFSTRDEVNAISGRGVGLDVVRANLQAIKGSVRLESESGEGTRFLLTVPLTLATDHGLLVRAGGAAYALPITAVERVLEVPQAEVIAVQASQAILIEGRPVPLRDLAAVLGDLPGEAPADGMLLVTVVGWGWHRVALRVDELLGEREIVVKRLAPPLWSVRHLSGATLTGTGEVIMVLNAAQVVDTALQLEAPPPPPEAEAGRKHPPRVLVVDDSITTRTLERTILESKGYEVTTAVHGKEAWELLQTQPFDLVISDVEMPVMNGFELTAQIKQSPTLRQTPVIIVSSLGREEDRRRGLEAGADAYIVKSEFETRALLDVVRQLI